jgi:hypothetical protein
MSVSHNWFGVVGGERPLDQIVVNRRSRRSAAAALTGVVAEDPLVGA